MSDCRELARLMFLMACLGALSGCSVLGRTSGKCCDAKPAPGVVRTGGPFAVARAIPIPPEGLTLSDAVELSLRPGLAGTAAAAAPGLSPQETTPIAQRPIPVPEFLKGIVGGLDVTSADSPADANQQIAEAAGQIVQVAVSTGAVPGDKAAALQQQVTHALSAAANDGAFRASNDEALLQQSLQRRETLLQELARLIAPTGPAAPAPQEAAAAPENATAPAPAPPAGSPADRLAVVLSRPGGRTIVIPLTFVRTYIPGDIQLVNGDWIEILPFDQTAAGARPEQPATATVAVTSWAAAEGLVVPVEGGTPTLQELLSGLGPQPADVVLLRRFDEEGRFAEYLLPAADAGRLSGVYLQDNDLIHFDLLALTPLIRTSRQQVAAGAAPPAGPCPPIEAGLKKLTAIPGCLDAQCKQLTGLSGADLGQGTDRALKDLGGMLPNGLP